MAGPEELKERPLDQFHTFTCRQSRGVAKREGKPLQVCAVQRKQGHDRSHCSAVSAAENKEHVLPLRWPQGQASDNLAVRNSIQGAR